MSHETSAQSREVGLVHSLGPFDITMIVAFALNGIITVFTAMVYAERGSAIPEAGGGYLWVKEGLPGPNAFLSGWMSWFADAIYDGRVSVSGG